jgi:hypothetical protein
LELYFEEATVCRIGRARLESFNDATQVLDAPEAAAVIH